MALPVGTAQIREIFRHYKRSARKRGLVFELTIVEFRALVIRYCYYCGAPPSVKEYTMTKKKFPTNGIDRVDSKLGYTLDNCVPACKDRNRLKSARSLEDFLAHIRRIYAHSKNLIKKP